METKQVQDKLAKAKEQFKVLQGQEAQILEQAKKMNQDLAQVREEMIRVQGDYRTLKGLTEELTGNVDSETIVKKGK